MIQQDNGQNREKHLRRRIVLLAIATAAVFSLVSLLIWKSYRKTLMDTQKEELLLISQTLAQNLEVSMQEFQDSAAYFGDLEDSGLGTRAHYEKYLGAQQGAIEDLCWFDSEEHLEKSIRGTVILTSIPLGQASEKGSFWLCEDQEGQKFLAVRRTLRTGGYLALLISVKTYYEQLLSNIRVGTNGYFVVKSSDQTIIMHPKPEQWGINVIEGRKELYPGLDLESLENMVQEQASTESGVLEYYSYWWTDPAVPRVRKIASHAWVMLGTESEDFWIVSAVLDYSDFFLPIQNSFRSLLSFFLCFGLVILLLTIYIGNLTQEGHQKAKEIAYLRELNETLEALHRSEEVIVHQQRLQVIGAMTGGIAHEFNNFLTPIMGHADLLMAILPEDDDAYDSAREIYETSEKARDLIRQIASLSTKNVETVFSKLSAKDLLHRTVRMMKAACPKNVFLETDLQIRDECLLGNDIQLSQVVMNLCMNAIHAIGNGEGRITFRGENAGWKTVADMTRETISGEWKQYLHIELSDTGCGMDSTTLRRIFEPFFTTKKTGEGTGLGLSLADQIIRSHRGIITVESEVGRGTSFHIFLPLMEAEAEPKTISGEEDRKLQVIVADDNKKILDLLHRQLGKLGMEVRTCSARRELLELLDRNAAGILLLDISLKDIDGIEFCMSVHGKYPNLVKIIMVDVISKEVLEASHKGIIDAFVDKPVSVETLLETIDRCLISGDKTV